MINNELASCFGMNAGSFFFVEAQLIWPFKFLIQILLYSAEMMWESLHERLVNLSNLKIGKVMLPKARVTFQKRQNPLYNRRWEN